VVLAATYLLTTYLRRFRAHLLNASPLNNAAGDAPVRVGQGRNGMEFPLWLMDVRAGRTGRAWKDRLTACRLAVAGACLPPVQQARPASRLLWTRATWRIC